MSEKQDKRTAGTVNPPEDWLLQFDNYLENKGVSPRTAASYRAAVRLYYSLYKELTPENITAFKNYLVSRYKSSTVNLRLHGINQFIRAVEGAEEGLSGYQIPSIKQQQKTFLEHVISQKDYERIKRGLKKDQCMMWYFVVRFLCATGTRISELLQIKAEHVRIGYMDLCSKGGKIRRIYFPELLCQEALVWLEKEGRTSGFLFTNRQGEPLTPRGVSLHLKAAARKYHVPEETVYPHSFRHRFAKNFLAHFNDIALLADLMGHESIETTRIYLTKSCEEQRALIDRIVTW